jgi:starvation-inducible DNA-binding protein
MSKSYPTKIDLAAAVRGKIIDLLGANLADAIHLALQAKQAHWNVKGPAFFPLHELFDKLYDEATEWGDLIAERVVQFGGVADGTLKTVAATSRLAGYKLALSDGRDHLEAISGSVAAFGKSTREAIDIAAQAGDAGTADLFTEISRAADKMLWFLEAHLQAER